MSEQMPRNLRNFNKAEFQEWLDSFDVILFDCDGVIWFLHKIMEYFKGCDRVVNTFMTLGKRVYFLTNNSMDCRSDQVMKAQTLGFNIKEENMITTSFLAAEYLKRLNFQKTAYVIGMSGITKELNLVGIKNYGEGLDPTKTNMVDLYVNDIKNDPNIGAVIVGNDIHLSLPKLGRATTFLINNSDSILLCTKPELKFTTRNVTLPFPGAIAKSLEAATNKKSIILGKPSDFLATVLFEREKSTPRDRFLMVGDTLETDIEFGNKNGMQTLLVGTGTNSLVDVEQIVNSGGNPLRIPRFYIPKLIDLLVDNQFGCKL